MSLPLVAVVGRPNVGKSSFINRIAARNEAITHKLPGVTRDRKYIQIEWSGKSFTVIDTGGIEFFKSQSLVASIKQQAEVAVEEAQAIIFMVDFKEGIQPGDEDIAENLRKKKKQVFLVVNKVDDPQKMLAAGAEFYKLGLGEPYAVSASHGLGIADLLDEVAKILPEATPVSEEIMAVAVIGTL